MLPTKNNLAAIRPLMFAPIETVHGIDGDKFERRFPDADAVHGREVCATPVRADGAVDFSALDTPPGMDVQPMGDARWTPAVWVFAFLAVAIVVMAWAGVGR